MAIRPKPIFLPAATAVLLTTQLLYAAPANAGPNFSVNSTADLVDANPGDKTCATTAGTCTLRAAVMEANASESANKIELPAGHYILIGTKGEDGATTGDLDVNGGVLKIFGAGAGATILDGGDVDRIFHLGPLATADFMLRGVTVQNGNAFSDPVDRRPGGPDVGGGIRIERNSGLTVKDAIFENNRAGARGGAIGMPPNAATVAGADPAITTELTHVTIRNNRAHIEGAAMFNNRLAHLDTMVIEDNVVDGPACAPPPASQAFCPRGGAIAQSGDLRLTDVILRRNAIPNGIGGAIANRGDPAAQIFGTIRLSKVTVQDNLALVGGGVATGNSATGFLENTTISGNTARQHGGGFVNAGTAELTNVTFSGNAAGAGGGLLTVGGQPAGADNASTTLRSTILKSARGGNCKLPEPGLEFLRAPTSAGDNISSDGTCALNGPGDRNGVDPMLGSLADNGGFTPTHALLAGSPAIDSVHNNACPPPATDQRGVSRPQGARCDIGAYEAA